MPTTKDRIAARINRLGAGRAFTPKDFLDLGSRGMVDATLSSMLGSPANSFQRWWKELALRRTIFIKRRTRYSNVSFCSS